eukprot:jgi/Bigna1/80060/fgenesh1_pg.67_\
MRSSIRCRRNIEVCGLTGGWIHRDDEIKTFSALDVFDPKSSTFDNFVKPGRRNKTWRLTLENDDEDLLPTKRGTVLPDENIKLRPYRSHKDKMRRKLERRLKRRPLKEPTPGHEDDNIFDSDFSQTDLSSEGGIMWTSEAALSTENTDTDRGPEREGGLAFDHMIDEENVLTERRVAKMMRRMNITDPYERYKNVFSSLPQMSAKPYKFPKNVHMISSFDELRKVVELSKDEGQPNVTVLVFMSYHIKFRQQCKMYAPFIEEAARYQTNPAIYGIVDVGKFPLLMRASGSRIFPYTHIYVRGVKKFDFPGHVNTILMYYTAYACDEADPSRLEQYPDEWIEIEDKMKDEEGEEGGNMGGLAGAPDNARDPTNMRPQDAILGQDDPDLDPSFWDGQPKGSIYDGGDRPFQDEDGSESGGGRQKGQGQQRSPFGNINDGLDSFDAY